MMHNSCFVLLLLRTTAMMTIIVRTLSGVPHQPLAHFYRWNDEAAFGQPNADASTQKETKQIGQEQRAKSFTRKDTAIAYLGIP